jgi:hypothetical protein
LLEFEEDLRVPEIDDTFVSDVNEIPLLFISEDDNDDKPESSPTDDVPPCFADWPFTLDEAIDSLV